MGAVAATTCAGASSAAATLQRATPSMNQQVSDMSEQTWQHQTTGSPAAAGSNNQQGTNYREQQSECVAPAVRDSTDQSSECMDQTAAGTAANTASGEVQQQQGPENACSEGSI
ncbi:hypothetical protein ABPG75_006733 [Micractinium tetrahymenae]